MSDIYKQAAQVSLRFPSTRGNLVVEQLFQLPLRSTTGGPDLDTLAKDVNAELKGVTEESFVDDSSSDPRKALLTLKLDILKDVIKTKQEANKAELARRQRSLDRAKILDAIAAKKDQALTTASLEDLQKQLDALDA